MDDTEAIKFTIGKKEYPTVKLKNRDTCLACGRKLTNPKSIERGLGPVCWKKWNRPRQIFPDGFLVPKWVLKSPRFEQEVNQRE